MGNQPPNGKINTQVPVDLLSCPVSYRNSKFLFQVDNRSLPGYGGSKTIQITYFIPDGTQGHNPPNPGKRNTGTTRVAYLPDTLEGREVLKVCLLHVSICYH